MKYSLEVQQDNFLHKISFSFHYCFPFSTFSIFIPPSPHFKNTLIQYRSKHVFISYSLQTTSFFDADGNIAKNLLDNEFIRQLRQKVKFSLVRACYTGLS